MSRLALIGAWLNAAAAFGQVATAPHVEVKYEGIDSQYATALAETASAAWQVCTDEFGLDMPPTIVFSVACADGEPTRLYNDGQDHLFLTIPSAKKLARPAKSGVFNLYGVCHELAHVGMYRTLKHRDWLSTAGAEGWAHYAGSVIVDRVYAAKGEKLWPDAYDYRQDGTARLEKQLADSKPSDLARAAGCWKELEVIISRRGFAKAFAAWQKAKVNPEKPSKKLLGALVKLHADKEDRLKGWWKSAAPLLVEKREASEVQAVSISRKRLTGHPMKLAFDDDGSEGKKSIAGGGHARKFSAPGGGEWYICAVSVYGARYGAPQAPDMPFEVALCDADMKPIKVWEKPYAEFERGELAWVRLEIPPTRVPREFCVCLNFEPTATRGVYVGFDDSTHGDSLIGTPGKRGSPLEQGDWMIRVELDQPKEADALKGKKQ